MVSGTPLPVRILKNFVASFRFLTAIDYFVVTRGELAVFDRIIYYFKCLRDGDGDLDYLLGEIDCFKKFVTSFLLDISRD